MLDEPVATEAPWLTDPLYGGMSPESARKSWETSQRHRAEREAPATNGHVLDEPIAHDAPGNYDDGPQRIDAIAAWLHSKVGPELGRTMMGTLVTAGQVEGFERLIDLFSSQGGGSFRQSGRDSEEERGKIPGYENMTFEQRRAAQFAHEAGRKSR